jgi:hypothetical protein
MLLYISTTMTAVTPAHALVCALPHTANTTLTIGLHAIGIMILPKISHANPSSAPAYPDITVATGKQSAMKVTANGTAKPVPLIKSVSTVFAVTSNASVKKTAAIMTKMTITPIITEVITTPAMHASGTAIVPKIMFAAMVSAMTSTAAMKTAATKTPAMMTTFQSIPNPCLNERKTATVMLTASTQKVAVSPAKPTPVTRLRKSNASSAHSAKAASVLTVPALPRVPAPSMPIAVKAKFA